MAIDILTSNAYKAMPEALGKSSRTTGPHATAGSDSHATAAPADSVELTASARTLASATAVAMASDGVDSSKVETIRQALKDGTYHVNYDSVASRIIESERDLSSLFG
ncbi:MAG TPA: flagellar biosynthesis anti-sigma factor FlgM [Candidatus Avisuccinivibrio pullicola]|nr:flagellar biosynthesis anti-sigma factor FlgM [Candidatus Avisuccinivibrio pullicola]